MPVTPSGTTHSNVLLKLFLIGFLVIALMVPMFTIGVLISERLSRQFEAEAEIHQTWGGPQTLGGPLVTVPYDRWATDAEGKEFLRREFLRILPEDLEITGDLESQTRRRGLFETPVFVGRFKLQALFRMPDPARLFIEPTLVRWNEATVRFGVTDLRGLDGNPRLVWQGTPLELEAANDPEGPFPNILAARLDLRPDFAAARGEAQDALVGTEHRVEIDLDLRGAAQLNVLPLGRETRLTLASPWSAPKFQGAFLPVDREVGPNGFEASWSIPHFARSYPQAWTGQGWDPNRRHALQASAFGVELLMPGDFYQQVNRCTKYSVLFIGLTFAVFCLFELLQGLRIHPVQYGMVGFAMCLFYLLLLALAEHLGFDPAYLLASLATVVLITAYSGTVLGTRGRASILAANLVVLYGVLYVLVQLQTYALLVGAIGLFLVLAAAMYLTRDIDWYTIGRRRSVDHELAAYDAI